MTDDRPQSPHRAALRCPPPEPVERGHLALGEPPGALDRIEVTGGWIERAGMPWFPVTGEIHYSRLPRERWAEILGHARAGGLNSVATYVFWRYHEPEPGRFRWDGALDLRAFIELAAAQGLDVVVRMGPWAHGEARYGGFPDWLAESDIPTRTNDPAYLALVRAFYAATIAQLGGLTHAEGGPVIAAQLDNELYDRPEHLAVLREIAGELGLRVPVWTATGWGGAQVPETLLPVYGAYADGFWEEAESEWPAFAQVHFRYHEDRDDLSVGADLREGVNGGQAVPSAASGDSRELPFVTCELGGGMHVAYHRRPQVEPEDVAAIALAKLGSGSVWQGYYMYAGGTHRSGGTDGEQESHATGYPNDLPLLTYDFHAPIGEHGQIRPHHHLLRRQHLWLATDGHRLATMSVHIGGGDGRPGQPRWAVRSDGHTGYLFLTTYQPHQPLPAQPRVQFTVAFDDGDLTVPTEPIDVPSGRSLVWPLRHPLAAGLVLHSATAQLLTRIADDEGELVVFAATDGVPVELVIDGRIEVGGAGGGHHQDEKTVVGLVEPPGPGCLVRLPGVRVLILDPASANRLYHLELAGRERLILSDAPVYTEDGQLVAHPTAAQWTVSILPAPAGLEADIGEPGAPRADGPWRTWTVPVRDAGSLTLVEGLRPAHDDPPEPGRGGPRHRLSAPTDYSGAARIRVDVPATAFNGADRVLLRVTWTGDVGRARIGDRLVSDHYWHGRIWDIDLTPHRDQVVETGVRLELLPWRAGTGVWVDPAVRDVPDGVAIDAIRIVRVGKVRVRGKEAGSGTDPTEDRLD
jgi:hypothetical protein